MARAGSHGGPSRRSLYTGARLGDSRGPGWDDLGGSRGAAANRACGDPRRLRGCSASLAGVSSAILPLLTLTIAALLALGVGCLALPGARPRSIGTVGMGVSLFGCVLALLAVVTAEPTAL